MFQELQRATNDWYGSIRGTTDPYQLRRSYSGIDAAWHRLQGQLSAPGVANQAINEELRRVDQADVAIHQALNLNAYPVQGGGQPAPPPDPTLGQPVVAAPAPPAAPTGLDETRRLAYALAQRGEALASTIQSVYGNDPNAASLVNDSAEIARIDDGFYDGLNNPAGQSQPEATQQAFVPIIQKSTALGIALGSTQMPAQLQGAWNSYTSVHNLLRANLNLVNAAVDFAPPPNVGPGIPYNPNPTAPVAQWAEGLDRQVDDLRANFPPNVNDVPDGRELLSDIERLRDDVRRFRREAAQGGDVNRLAFCFRDVDTHWQRVARRVNRIARGGTSPNIQRTQQIGQTIGQIHQALGMPGYPATIQPY